MCFRWLNLFFILGFDLFCLYLVYRRSLLCINRFISEVTHGCPSLGLHNLFGTYFSVSLFRDPLNSFHLVLMSQFSVFSSPEPKAHKVSL